jgi:hypothetical protein
METAWYRDGNEIVLLKRLSVSPFALPEQGFAMQALLTQ